MGGHGGLNILPQKSWNVYGQKQQQKVQRDEEKAEAEESAALEATLQGLRDERSGVLHERASKRRRDEGLLKELPPTEHVNFFAAEEEELAKRLKAERELKPEEKPDDSARLGHGSGSGAAPWYAQKGSSFFNKQQGSDTALGDNLP
eukprot:CAMPEP_0197599430 /NCGR_PEP_ID=MMETSP1326-20131121/31369_1 /TAXON_ID=1155430 /ORGANISM="Genus nov. species nov., Strain RCC2288" /LENGTH=146 /DNA_ID=CAMNT_0043166399 /DNA_START=226 /DNA_END=662 /DNA_ORIENTATION=+